MGKATTEAVEGSSSQNSAEFSNNLERRSSGIIKRKPASNILSASKMQNRIHSVRLLSEKLSSNSDSIQTKQTVNSENKVKMPTNVFDKNSEECTMTRQRALKHGGVPKCNFCKEEQKSGSERLKQCSGCNGNYHIKKCMRYKTEFAQNIERNTNWKCPRCTMCAGCRKFVDDPGNIECTACCRAWHAACAPNGCCPTNEYESDWFCDFCCYQRGIRVARPVSERRQPIPVEPESIIKKSEGRMVFEEDTRPLIAILDARDCLWERLNSEAGMPPINPVLFQVQDEPKKKAHKRKSSACLTEQSALQKSRRIDKLVLPFDRELYKTSKVEAYRSEPTSNGHEDGQWLHFGTGKTCKAVYRSAYEGPRASALHLYACMFCLHTTHLKADFIVHHDLCKARYPPGNEIYRDEGLSFFEVDGAKQKTYCQNLCLLAKLFIVSKTLYEEVETFTFYVLCEITRKGCLIVGYFSKEKNPSKNNNLSCLLVLPMAQNMGYGRLLIDMSYELSRIERRVGHPEHPLSDLGILAYRGYWRSSLLCYLRSLKQTDTVSLKDMCLETRIDLVDIVNQLMLDNLIVFKGGTYFVKITRRALKYPLSQCRRRAIDRNKLIWAPDESCEDLDPNQINTYA